MSKKKGEKMEEVLDRDPWAENRDIIRELTGIGLLIILVILIKEVLL